MLPGSALKASRFGCTTSLIKSLGLISDVPAEGVRVLGGSCQRNSEVSLKANVRKWHDPAHMLVGILPAASRSCLGHSGPKAAPYSPSLVYPETLLCERPAGRPRRASLTRQS